MNAPPHVSTLTYRLATRDDLTALREIMALAVDQGQRAFLSAQQIEASHRFMGLDTQLIDDRTYFVIETEGRIVGCGGWSRRATL